MLGDAVRYDGQSKPCAIIIEQLKHQYELIPICPEVEAGLSIPRPPVQLTGSIESPRLVGRDNPDLDITDLMHNYCKKKLPELNELRGFIFKSHSPSCGHNSTPVFINGDLVTETSSGIFACAVQTAYPNLPVIDEIQLESNKMLNDFLQAITSSSS